MRVFRTLYAKIFGWFWLTLTVGSILLLAVTFSTGTQLLGRRWMRLTQDMYARSAVDFYLSGGRPALEQYVETLRTGSGISACLLDGTTRAVLGGTLPAHIDHVLSTTAATGASSFRLGFVWTAASPVWSAGHLYYFVIEVRPLHGFLDGRIFSAPLLSRLALVFAVAGVFSFFLARHIVAPVRAMQIAAQELASGNLRSRVLPSLGPREDELADMALSFDQMADRIQMLIQRRQEMLADISHELRSPLTRVSVSLELLRRGEIDAIDKMQTDLDQMNEMIGQILLLTRLDLQPEQSAFIPVDLVPILRSIAADAEFEIQHDNKHVEIETRANCIVRGDANLLRSCIENVVRNAAHFTVKNTAVEIHLVSLPHSGPARQCELVVQDCGPGVPETALPFLFTPFFRVSESRDLRDGGTGLGLSISQRIAELHQGTISAANRMDRSGLIVRLQFPLA
ncbi:MAG TPA: ATP-binding protein [Terracidiphilus sp.]|nr:ATP-binding protein [Terracidiphilus sp.]